MTDSRSKEREERFITISFTRRIQFAVISVAFAFQWFCGGRTVSRNHYDGGSSYCGNELVEQAEVCDDGNHDSGDGCSADCFSDETCGNGVLDWAVGEECDDGNMHGGDGCGAACRFEGCGNEVIDWEAGEVCDDGNLLSGDGCSSDCRSDETCGNGLVDVGEVCDDANSSSGDGCSEDCSSDETCGNGIVDEVVGEECDEGATNSDAPNETCRTNCLLRRCGDGSIDELFDEVCDDGNPISGDGCSSGCYSDETCGNGYVDDSMGEECDDGGHLAGDGCGPTCLAEECGNSFLDPTEACDDGNSISGDGCSADCASDESCGNGILDAVIWEECDQGADNSSIPNADCRLDCRYRRCGDGIVDELFGEICDLGSANSQAPNTGCRTDCLPQRCGDGIVDTNYGEVCDDANQISTDTCDSACQLGPCGNGILENAEQCDDGNVYDWDGCTGCIITELQVNTIALNNSNRPETAMNDTSVVIVWSTSHVGNLIDVHGQIYTVDGISVGSEFLVNTTQVGCQHFPDVAISDSGSFVIVWESGCSIVGSSDIYAQRFAGDGNLVGAEILVNTYTTDDQRRPAVAMAADGRFVVVWRNYGAGSHFGLLGQRFTPAGSPAGAEFRVDANINSYMGSGGVLQEPSVAMASDGRFVIVWTGWDGGDLNVYGQRYDADGIPLGTEFLVNSSVPSFQAEHSVAVSSDASFVVVWKNWSDESVYCQRYTADGSPLGSEFMVSTNTSLQRWSTSVASADDGRFAVVWQSDEQDGSSYGVFGRRYAADGSPTGGEFQVNVYTDSVQWWPAIAMASDGRFVVTWESDGPGYQGLQVFAQRYDVQGQPLGLGP